MRCVSRIGVKLFFVIRLGFFDLIAFLCLPIYTCSIFSFPLFFEADILVQLALQLCSRQL